MKNKKSNYISLIISLSFILMSFLGTVHFCCFDENFYTKQHEKIMLYGKHINEYIGISNEQLSDLTKFTLDYLNNADASLDLEMQINGVEREVYTNDEKLHMVDVRNLNLISVYLLKVSIFIFVISLLIFLFKHINLNSFYVTYRKTLKTTFTIFLIIGIWIFIDFDSFWTLFHRIFFTGNELWLLDLRKDILIMIVPPEFFNHLVIRIIILFIICIFSLYVILYLLNKRKKIIND